MVSNSTITSSATVSTPTSSSTPTSPFTPSSSSSPSHASPSVIDPAHTWGNIARSLLAGGLAGCVAKTAVAPLDRVKILFQGGHPNVIHFSGSVLGSFRAVDWLARNQGFLGLYKGHGATLLRIFPYAAVNYMCFEQYKKILNTWYHSDHTLLTFLSSPSSTFTTSSSKPNDRDLPPLLRLFAGSCAGTTSVLLTYPLDYVHSRISYQIKTDRYKGVWHTIVTTLKEDGFKGLYRGFGPTVLGIAPYAGVSFYSYDMLKQLATSYFFPNYNSRQDSHPPVLPVWVRLTCGACAGAAAQTASYPLDVIRRRMQLHGLAQLPRYRNTLHAFREILRTEGWRALYLGLSINYIKVGPAHAVSFVTYEFFRSKLDVKGPHSGGH